MAAIALAVVALGLWGWRAAAQVMPGAAFTSWSTMGMDLVVAALAGLLIATVIVLGGTVLGRTVPGLFLWLFLSSLIVLATMGAAAAQRGWWLITAVVMVAVPVLSGLAGSARSSPITPARIVAGAVAGAVLASCAVWLALPGQQSPAVQAASGLTPGESADPGAPGPYGVTSLRYGSEVQTTSTGSDRAVDVTTAPVDARGIITNWPQSLTSAWGFDASQLPLNATVWKPQAQGPFPLVLMVHGQTSVPASEEGLGYLGQLLASRGYVVASIDENFLNASVLSGGVGGLDAARAWLVLEHARQWQAWSTDPPGHGPLAGVADTDALTLVGHSRGGEAVATATVFNRLPAYPENTSVPFDFNFDIATVVGLAPSDGVYRPGGAPVRLEGVNYLAIAGSYDADVLTFAGAQQYARTQPGPGQVKATALIDRANHTQFNSTWGRHDGALGLAKYVLSTGVLMSPQEQQHLAAAYLSAFLDLTVRDQHDNASLFTGHTNTTSWLPPTSTIGQFASGPAPQLLGEGTAIGAAVATTTLPTRTGRSDIPVQALTWTDPPPVVRYRVPLAPRLMTADDVLRVDLADATPSSTSRDDISVSLSATDQTGVVATIDLGGLPRQLPGQFTKGAVFMPTASSEPTLTTFAVPVSALVSQGLTPESTQSVTFTFTTPSGTGIYLTTVSLNNN